MTLPIPPGALPSYRTTVPTQAAARIQPQPESPLGSGGSTADSTLSKSARSQLTDAIGSALDTLGELEETATDAGTQAATGELSSVSDFMIATAEAQLSTEITVAIRDRAIAAFNDIMRMQI